MSFVERNKAWLLPLLAVGVAGVLWHDFSGTATPPSPEIQAQAQTAPADAPQSRAVAASPVPAIPSTDAAVNTPPLGPDAWTDLSLLNAVPSALNQSTELSAHATRPLTAEQLASLGDRTDAPAAMPSPAILTLSASAGSGTAEAPPQLEFISRTPDGLRAWYQGVGFKVGQVILGTGYRIQAISPPRVVLEGPAGRAQQSTFILERAGEAHRETP